MPTAPEHFQTDPEQGGIRLTRQGSVFKLPVDRALLDRCLSELSGLINSAEDHVAVYRLYASCESERFYLGVGETTDRIGEGPVFTV